MIMPSHPHHIMLSFCRVIYDLYNYLNTSHINTIERLTGQVGEMTGESVITEIVRVD